MSDFRKGGILQGYNSSLYVNGREFPPITHADLERVTKAIVADTFTKIIAKAEAQRLATKAQCYSKASNGQGFLSERC